MLGQSSRTRESASQGKAFEGGDRPSTREECWAHANLAGSMSDHSHILHSTIASLRKPDWLENLVFETKNVCLPQITALRDHHSHTEAQLAAEKERSLSFYQGLKTAKQTLEEDRETRQVAVSRATAALTQLDHEEAHWRKIDGVNKSLERDLSEARAQLDRFRGVEKGRALLEERLTEERQGRERSEGAAQGLREERTRLAGELERLTGVEVVLLEVEETRDALQVRSIEPCVLQACSTYERLNRGHSRG